MIIPPEFDEAVLFYRSLLGLAPHESLELAAPQGLVRSRAMTNIGDRPFSISSCSQRRSPFCSAPF